MVTKKQYIIKFILYSVLIFITWFIANNNYNHVVFSGDVDNTTKMFIDDFSIEDVEIINEFSKSNNIDFLFIDSNFEMYLTSELNYDYVINKPIGSKEVVLGSNLAKHYGSMIEVTVDLQGNDINLLKQLENYGYEFYGNGFKYDNDYIFYIMYLLMIVFIINLFVSIIDFNLNYKILVNNYISGRSNLNIILTHFSKLIILELFLASIFIIHILSLSSFLNGVILVIVLVILTEFLSIGSLIGLTLFSLIFKKFGNPYFKVNFIVYIIKFVLIIFFTFSLYSSFESINNKVNESNKISEIYSGIEDYGYLKMSGNVNYQKFENDNLKLRDYVLDSDNIEYIFFEVININDENGNEANAILMNENFLKKYIPTAMKNSIYYDKDFKNIEVLSSEFSDYSMNILSKEVIIPSLKFNIFEDVLSYSSNEYALITVSDDYIMDYGNVGGGLESNLKIKIKDEKLAVSELGNSSEYVTDYITYKQSIELVLKSINGEIILILRYVVLLVLILIFVNYFIFNLYIISNMRKIVLMHISGKGSLKIFKKVLIIYVVFYLLMLVGLVFLIIQNLSIQSSFIIVATLIFTLLILIDFAISYLFINKLVKNKINLYMKGELC